MLIGGLTLLLGGIWFTLNPDIFIPNIFQINDPDIIRLFGIFGIVFFGSANIYGAWKLFDKNPGLIIDSDGITDNSNASSIGLIKWIDISGIRSEQVMSTKFLLIDISEPEKYISRANGIKSMLMRANMKKYGTPLTIISSTLKYDFGLLENLIINEFEEYKTQGNNA